MVGAAIAAVGAFLPYVVSGLAAPWETARATLVAGAVAGVVAHEAVHVVLGRRAERTTLGFIVAALLPGVLAGAAALAGFALVPALRAPSYAALVANAAASAVDVWEAALVARLGAASVRREPGGRLACRVAVDPTCS